MTWAWRWANRVLFCRVLGCLPDPDTSSCCFCGQDLDETWRWF